MHRSATIFVLALALFACNRGTPPPSGGDSRPPSGPTPDDGGAIDQRTPSVPTDHALYGRFEGEGFANECMADGDCHRSGCGSEVCSADPEVMSTCEVLPVSLPDDATCACLGRECRWTSPSGRGLTETPAQ